MRLLPSRPLWHISQVRTGLVLAGFCASALLTACGGGDSASTATPATPTSPSVVTPAPTPVAASSAPVVTLVGKNRVVGNTQYSYSASLTNGVASAWEWLWGDNGSSGRAATDKKVWLRPGSYSTKVTATVNGTAVSATQTTSVIARPVALGLSHSCAITAGNTVNCWGDNFYGQLGLGDRLERRVPTAVPGLTDVVGLAANNDNTCALKGDGTVRCWGYNAYGQLGDGSTVDKASPVAVAGLTNVTGIALGVGHSCAVKADGTAFCWGSGTGGQLGNGQMSNQSIPVQVKGLSAVVALATGQGFSCAQLADGRVSCWGTNGYGELATGVVTVANTADAQTTSLSNVVALSAGWNHACAVISDGSVSCWGRNNVGQIADGNSLASSPTPKIVAGLSGVAAISSGQASNCALVSSDGSLRCWGDNLYSQLGTSSSGRASSATPIAINGFANVASVGMGSWHSCALQNDGAVQCWGSNGSGRLGSGNPSNAAEQATPLAVVGGSTYWK
jgi:alpha-tubulin suppressor-like RCC1 family protein